jgi:hypothetical protein
MIALILAGAAFLTLRWAYIGLPRHLAEWIGSLGLSQFWLIFAASGCFFIPARPASSTAISMVVLTMWVVLPDGAGRPAST